MRKLNINLTRRHLVAVTGIALALVACNRDSRRDIASNARTNVGSDSSASAGFTLTKHRAAVDIVRDGPSETALSASLPADAMASPAAPAMSPAPTPPARELATSAPTASESAPALDLGAPLPPASDPAGAMLVRHGEASVEVKHVDDAVAKIRQSAAQFGGFIANTAIRNGKDEQPSASLEVRVPTAQFDGFVGELRTLGKVETVTASAVDVGEEYVDLGARAANARRVEARLVELLATRTGKLSDVLTVEQELARVRQEIERHDARLRFLERRAALSSLNVTLHQPLALIDRPQPGPIVEAVALAWERILSVLAWCIASLGIIVPIGVLIGLGWLMIRRANWPRFRSE
ncbi:MAG: DUF4349 domain-containing protein [bacterium]